jgi:DNA-binding transcriptional MerR regulator
MGPFTIFQLAHAAGMAIDEVRLHRDSGLLQPPRRGPSRRGDMAFYDEHVERLRFIRRALACGLTHDDIAQIVRPHVTCGDVSAVAKRRMDAIRAAGSIDAREATCLAGLYEVCSAASTRRYCPIFKALSGPGADA